MAEPPSIDKGEVTDKGSINQRAVLKHRDALVQALHDGTLPFTHHAEGTYRMNIQGHAALVTGGASGLGEATARELARLGAKVAVLDVTWRWPKRWPPTSTVRPASATSPAPTA
jgi:hypothetical protein